MSPPMPRRQWIPGQRRQSQRSRLNELRYHRPAALQVSGTLGTTHDTKIESYRITAGNHIVDGFDHVNDANEGDRSSPRAGSTFSMTRQVHISSAIPWHNNTALQWVRRRISIGHQKALETTRWRLCAGGERLAKRQLPRFPSYPGRVRHMEAERGTPIICLCWRVTSSLEGNLSNTPGRLV